MPHSLIIPFRFRFAHTHTSTGNDLRKMHMTDMKALLKEIGYPDQVLLSTSRQFSQSGLPFVAPRGFG